MAPVTSTFPALCKVLTSNSEASIEKISSVLLRLLENVINEPSNEKFRKIRSENRLIKDMLQEQGTTELLQEVGFVLENEVFVLPSTVLIARLKDIHRILRDRPKLSLEAPSNSSRESGVISKKLRKASKPFKVKFGKHFSERTRFPSVLRVSNPFLRQLETLSDGVMQYEDIVLQKSGQAAIPIEKLRLKAIEALRRFQKSQKPQDLEPSLEDLLLYELAEWFRSDFMKWVNQLECPKCGNEKTQALRQTSDQGIRVEEYACCGSVLKFYRYNDVSKLLLTRRGRCGEFANLFTFLCRCLGYDARYVFCTEDHVWTEVYSHTQKRWLHIDPSDNVIDSPLMYEHGWKKVFRYVIAFSRDDVQDVSWRYTNQHNEILKRRTECSEKDLLRVILDLRKKRQEGLSELRLAFLRKRSICELADFTVERQPTEDERRGRSSGSLEWRQSRAETHSNNFFVFEATDQEVSCKQFNLRYSCAKDEYQRGQKTSLELKKWDSVVYHAENLARKVEHDWNMVYLARQEGAKADTATVVWRFDFSARNLLIKNIQIKFETATYEGSSVDVFYLNKDGIRVDDVALLKDHSMFSVKAVLRGGKGDCAWQHTQLFRQKKNSDGFPFELNVEFY